MSEAKIFIKSSPCQKVIDAIWNGKCVYTAESSHSLLSDTYKRAPIHYYDPRKAPLLDHYRSAPPPKPPTFLDPLLTSRTGSKCPPFGPSSNTSSEYSTLGHPMNHSPHLVSASSSSSSSSPSSSTIAIRSTRQRASSWSTHWVSR